MRPKIDGLNEQPLHITENLTRGKQLGRLTSQKFEGYYTKQSKVAYDCSPPTSTLGPFSVNPRAREPRGPTFSI